MSPSGLRFVNVRSDDEEGSPASSPPAQAPSPASRPARQPGDKPRPALKQTTSTPSHTSLSQPASGRTTPTNHPAAAVVSRSTHSSASSSPTSVHPPSHRPFKTSQTRYRPNTAGATSAVAPFAAPIKKLSSGSTRSKNIADDPDRNYFATANVGQLDLDGDTDDELPLGGFGTGGRGGADAARGGGTSGAAGSGSGGPPQPGPGFMKGFSGAGVGARKYMGAAGHGMSRSALSEGGTTGLAAKAGGSGAGPAVAPSSSTVAGKRTSTHSSNDPAAAAATQAEPEGGPNPEGKERLEWQAMLSSVLSGDVLRSEKTRIGGERSSSDVLRNELGSSLWWGIRARMRGRAEKEEVRRVQQRRERTVDLILDEVIGFKVVGDSPAALPTRSSRPASPTPVAAASADTVSPGTTAAPPSPPPAHHHPPAFDQVLATLSKLAHAESLYPHNRALGLAKPLYASAEFQRRVEALVSWSNVVLSLRTQISILQKWTGSEELDVKKVDTEEPIRVSGGGIGIGGGPNEDGKPVRPPTFVERVLKEDSLQRTFEKKTLSDVSTLISSAKETYLLHSDIFQQLNLPPYQAEITKLIAFPTQLVEESLRVRLAYALKIENPTVMVIDQLTDDFRLSIALACGMKKQYGKVIAPDAERKWVLPDCIQESYDLVLVEALKFFFRLLYWKLKSGSKAIYFRETEILEDEWEFLNDSAAVIKGGDLIVAEQYCSLTKKLMHRVIDYFETQLHVPSVGPSPAITLLSNAQPHASPSKKASTLRPLRSAFEEETVSVETKAGLDGKVTTTTSMVVAEKQLSGEEKVAWFAKILEAVRMRYRKLQRFARRLTNRFDNSAEFSLEDVDLEAFLPALYESGHFLVYTGTFEQEGIYVVADPSLREKPHLIEHLLTMAFLIDSTPKLQTGSRRASATGGGGGDADTDTNDEGRALGDSCYLLTLTPSQRFFWQGPIMHMPLPLLDLDLQDLRVRLIADGPNARLAEAKDRFLESLVQPDTDEGDAPPPPIELECIVEQQAHLPSIQRELRRIGVATIRLSEAIVESVSHVRLSLHGVPASQELVENWFAFSSDHGQRVGIYMDGPTWARFSRLLMRLAINWVAFICEDCDPTDHKTFRWTVNALEFAMVMTRGNNILHLDRGEFALLQEKVASCMALLISHFDILGARSSFEAKKEQERLAELRSMAAGLESAHDEDGVYYRSASPSDPAGDLAIKRLAGEWPGEGVADKSVRLTHETRVRLIQTLEEGRSHLNYDMHIVGRVVNTDRPEDRSLVALAASSSNISIHWQQGRFIGAGAYGKVYTAHNMDQNTVMAVKEIRFSDVSNLPTVYKEIRDESSVMQMLNHVNIVEYYGIEVHRDKVYIFQEYCDGGSLKDLLEHGRIEQEEVIMNYTCQILEGLQYLHEKGIVHRDIKPDNVLLTSDAGIIKLVDFGAAKVIARGHRTINRTRTAGMGSMNGTPMYMSPEVIKNTPGGRLGAMDIWSVGCMVLEFATGKKPWQSAENEWAIMFKIGGGEIPPLPDPDQISELGIDFILCCLNPDPVERPTADELLLQHPWMVAWTDFRDASYADPGMIADEGTTPGLSESGYYLDTPGESDYAEGDTPHLALDEQYYSEEGADMTGSFVTENIRDGSSPKTDEAY